jgi:hypothetical protein
VAGPDPQSPISPNAAGWLTAVKGLTVTNAVVIMLLVVALLPAYVGYRLVTDENLLDRFLSKYKIYGTQLTSCTLRQARQRGEPYTYIMSTGFAFEGEARWAISVSLSFEPSPEQQASYCRTLELIVDHMRGGNSELPRVVWQYRDVETGRSNAR